MSAPDELDDDVDEEPRYCSEAWTPVAESAPVDTVAVIGELL